MKITAISDMHGKLPNPERMFPGDILLIGGDICPTPNHDLNYQYSWLRSEFEEWLDAVPYQYKVGIAGNHDFIFEKESSYPGLDNLPWIYLLDSFVKISGLKIFGSPWIRNLQSWAFYKSDRDLEEHWDIIDDDTDIVMCHNPPLNCGDTVLGQGPLGCAALRRRIQSVQPKYSVHGHIHEGYGLYRLGQTDVMNVSYLNEYYQRANQPVNFEI